MDQHPTRRSGIPSADLSNRLPAGTAEVRAPLPPTGATVSRSMPSGPAAACQPVELVSPLTTPPRAGAVLIVVLLAFALIGAGGPAPSATAAPTEPVAPVSRISEGPGGAGPSTPGAWRPPLSGALEVIRPFAAPPSPWAAGHRGVDLAAASGDVRAPADGVVRFTGVVVDREVLTLDHGGGLVSSFEPAPSELAAGDTVAAGDVVAELGTYADGGHHCDRRCLHWGVRLQGEYINPLMLLGDLEPSVLLPLEAG
ncbi:M23 family metallopeptidase [Nesterenkonia sp. CL21]|uniref:M23 family metallopeptidase n=1 Tax=unclassified Nesterenkonia TaxID=2629769 RepID=UPI002879A962|nr:peptidoglycan DD-metalloendopeptidase family protein [Nesterenkonia sp. CL21]MDS2171276.1 peptidoglycan DD-metalloendopeptidase family protein [Nesterenkonia sp. CL21]